MMGPSATGDRCSVPRGKTAARPFSLAARLRSFVYAGSGIRVLIASQHNVWIHAAATCAVVGLALALRIPRLDWMALVVAIVSVWTAEAINTAIELVCDVASPDFHPAVKAAKDVSAGAVLICAVGASITGVLVLGPPLINILN